MSFHATTILALRHQGTTVFVGDGQVTVNNTVMKHGAVKIRRLERENILAGFAGSAADSFTLFERFQGKLNETQGKLQRACVALAKDWRTDRYLRRLEAMMVVGNAEELYLLSGVGDVIEPDDSVVGIGSGGNFALAAARALIDVAGTELSAKEIATKAMGIAATICPFTNDQFTVEELHA